MIRVCDCVVFVSIVHYCLITQFIVITGDSRLAVYSNKPSLEPSQLTSSSACGLKQKSTDINIPIPYFGNSALNGMSGVDT